MRYTGKMQQRCDLRTFVQKFSNIDFFLRTLPLKDDELVMSEMWERMEAHGFGETMPWK